MPRNPDPDALNYLLDAARDACLALAISDWPSAALAGFSALCWARQSNLI